MRTIEYIKMGIQKGWIDSFALRQMDFLSDLEYSYDKNGMDTLNQYQKIVELIFKKEFIPNKPDAQIFCPQLVKELTWESKNKLYNLVKNSFNMGGYKEVFN